MSIFLLCRFQESSGHNPMWQTLGTPPKTKGKVVKAVYTAIYAKVWINDDTYGEVTSDNSV